MVTVAVPPLQVIGVVTVALVMLMAAGCVMVRVPVAAAQLLASVTL